jgi:hypothetical protein
MKNHSPKQLDLFADVPPADVGKPKTPPVDEALLQRKIADTRQEVRNLTSWACA